MIFEVTYIASWLFSFRSAIFPSDKNSVEVLKEYRELMVKSHMVDFFFLFVLKGVSLHHIPEFSSRSTYINALN